MVHARHRGLLQQLICFVVVVIIIILFIYFYFYLFIYFFKEVIEVSRKYFPDIACGYDNPKLTIHHMDGAEFMSTKKESFDVIITDSSDPIGNSALVR